MNARLCLSAFGTPILKPVHVYEHFRENKQLLLAISVPFEGTNMPIIRELPKDPLDPAYWHKRQQEGWRLIAVEWQRDTVSGAIEPGLPGEIPYGLRIASDCKHLEDDPAENAAMLVIMESIVQDHKLAEAAAELNGRGFRTRAGTTWSAASVFALLPRLIEVGPRIFSGEDWALRRKTLFRSS